MKLVRMDSSGRKDSVSRQLTSEFAARWKKEHPGGEVTERDLTAAPFSAITDDWVSATRVPPCEWTDRQREAIARSDLFIAELVAADIIVIGTPMHNLTISWPLKAWIDQIVRVGKTVLYDEHGPRGVLEGRWVIVIASRGGTYRSGTPRAQMGFLALPAGFSDEEIVEIVALVALNVFRNYLNLVAETDIDFPVVKSGHPHPAGQFPVAAGRPSEPREREDV